MYSSLFRELHASRLQLDVTSTEERELTAGPDDDVRSDAAITDQHAIFESESGLELMEDQELTSLGNNMVTYLPESRGLSDSYYYSSDLSNASPGGAFLSRFETNDVVPGIPLALRGIHQTELVGCSARRMAAVVLPEAFDATSIREEMMIISSQQPQPSSLQVDAQQVQVADIPSSIVGFAPITDVAGVVAVSSSSSSSSPASSSSLSVMSASGAGGCGESSEDATTSAAAAYDDAGCSSSSSRGGSPHSGSCSQRCGRDEGTATAGRPPLTGGGPLDRSSPLPDADPHRIFHGSITLDHRRNSLELSCSGSRELVDGTSHHLLSQPGAVAAAGGSGGGAGGGGGDVPAHLRRASIPCMSASAARGLARGLAHRPSIALDYESLKEKLEELTGTVTDGKRAKEATPGDRSRRTSLVSLAHPPTAVPGSSAMTSHPEVDRLTPTLTSSAAAAAPGEGVAGGCHSSLRNNGFSASHAVAEADEDETDGHLQQQPIYAITQIAKNPTDDVSSSSSSSSSSLSSSLSSSSSSSWDKIRLQCVIEHVLQYDVRLQEILKRHELEMAAIQMKHRFQWMELEKWLTQRLGDQWRKFITIPALSGSSESVSTSPWRYPASVEGVDKTGQRDGGCPSNSVQNPFDPLQTIKEGQLDEDQLDSSAIRVCQQTTTATAAETMQNALQQQQQSTGRLTGDAAKSSAVSTTDHAGRRCSTDVGVDTPQRPRAISLSNVLLVGDKTATTGDRAESRICQNIASSLARRQSSVAIMNPNSSRLHRHTAAAKDVAPARPDSSVSMKPDPSAASTRPDSCTSSRPDASSASPSRPSTPQGDYRQLLLLAQLLQNQTYANSQAKPLLLPTAFPAVPFQTTNFTGAYGYDPASLLAMSQGLLPMEMGVENGFDLNRLRPAQALHAEVPSLWTSGGHQTASKNSSLLATGEELSRILPAVGHAQPLNGYPTGLPPELPGIGLASQTLQGFSFPGLLPSHLAPCQLPSLAQQNPWLLRPGSGTMIGDGPMTFVTPSTSSLGFPYSMMAASPAFYSLLKDHDELL